MSAFTRFAARTPEEAARRQFGLWAGLALVVLLPLWWVWGADIAAGLLRPLTGGVLFLTGLTGTINPTAEGDWSVGTRLTQAGQPLAYTVTDDTLRRLLLGFPMALAFFLAPPRPARPWVVTGISIVVLSLVFTLSVAAVVWGQLAPMLSPDLASATIVISTRPDQPPLPALAAQIAIVGRYVALSIAPLLTALLLWAVLNPAGPKTLVAEITD